MNDDTLTVTSHSENETEAIGKALMGLLPEGAVVALRGELGAGKTCLVRGMAAAIGTAAAVSSPTFTMVNEYEGTPKIYHVDLYRIAEPREVMDLGYEDLFDSPDGICVVEWAERAEKLLPPKRLDLTLEHAGKTTRTIHIRNHALLPQKWQRAIQSTPEF